MGQANGQFRRSSRKRCVCLTLAAALGVSRTPGLAEILVSQPGEGLRSALSRSKSHQSEGTGRLAHHAPGDHEPLLSGRPGLRAHRQTADFLKPCAYNNCAGPRFARYIRNVHSTVFRDLAPDEVLEFHYRLLGYEHEASLDKLPTTGMSAQYVARETRRALADVNGAVPIYPGIDIDIPTALDEKRTQPSDVKAAVLAAFQAGAPGVVLSRKYAEMKLTNLAGAGDALRETRA